MPEQSRPPLRRSRRHFTEWILFAAGLLSSGAILVYMQYGAHMPGWLHAKLTLVVLVIGYHHMCGGILKRFERGENKRSHKWFRVFNELPVFAMLAIVLLVVVKPF